MKIHSKSPANAGKLTLSSFFRYVTKQTQVFLSYTLLLTLIIGITLIQTFPLHAFDSEATITIAQPKAGFKTSMPADNYQDLNKISTDFIKNIIKKNKWNAEFITTESVPQTLTMMRAGKIDILPLFNKNKAIDTRGIVPAASTFFQLNTTIYTSRDSGVSFLQDIAGKSLATPLSGKLYKDLTDYFKKKRIRVKFVTVDNNTEAIKLLKSGKAAAIAGIDYFLNRLLQQTNQTTTIINTGYTFSHIPLTLIVSENFLSRDPQIFASINDSLSKVTSTRANRLNNIYDKITASEEILYNKNEIITIAIIAILLTIILYFQYIHRKDLLEYQRFSLHNKRLKNKITTYQKRLSEKQAIINTVISATYKVDIKTGHFTGDDNFFLIMNGEVKDYLTYQEVLDHLVTADFTRLFSHGRDLNAAEGQLELEPVTGRVFDANNNLRYIRIFSKSYYDQQGALEYRSGVIIDVTKEMLNKADSQLANNELSYIQKIAKVATWQINTSDIDYIITCREFFDIIGLQYSGNNTLHRSILELIFDKENLSIIQQLYMNFETESSTDFDDVLPIITLDTAEKKYIHIYSNKVNISLNDNTIVTGFIQDITERYTEQARAENTSKMKALGRLAGRVAHDFNNQLYGILGFSEMIQKEEISNTAREYLEYVILSAEQASDLIKNLLHFSRNYSQELERINIKEVTNNAISYLTHIFDTDIKIKKNITSAAITILGDYNEIKSTLVGLGTNARNAINKTGNNSGEITYAITPLEVTEDVLDEMEADLNLGNYAVISIQDNGCGMSADQQLEVLKPFYAAKEDADDTEENAGNDLATIYEIARSLGGGLKINSNVDQGTKVSLFLPAIEITLENSLTSGDHIGDLNLSGKNIFVIDTDKVILRQFKIIFETWGCSFKLENNSENALKEFLNKNIKYDIIIIDLFMPEIDGVSLYNRILNIAPETKIILMSGYYDHEYFENAQNCGVSAFIEKPITQGILLKKITEILNNENR